MSEESLGVSHPPFTARTALMGGGPPHVGSSGSVRRSVGPSASPSQLGKSRAKIPRLSMVSSERYIPWMDLLT